MSKNLKTAVAYFAPGTSPFALSVNAETVEARVWEKESVYEGTFTKDGRKFTVTPQTLQHWKQTTDLMLSEGLEIPCPLEHTDNPEKKRARVVGVEMRKNARGKLALFHRVSFLSQEAEDQLKHAQVSIFVPEERQVGTGKVFKRPISHLAFTDYPVLPGLEGFKCLAASFSASETSAMTLQQIADKIGVAGAVHMDDTAAESAVVQFVTDLQKKVTDLEAQVVELGGTPGEAKPTEEEAGKEPAPQVAASLSPMLQGIVKDARITKLDKLRDARKITPAVHTKLVAQYTAAPALALSVSKGDDFDAVVGALDLNEPVVAGPNGKTGPNVLKLSDSNKGESKVRSLSEAAAARRAEADKRVSKA